ncbi:C-Jun-amino-terminal kinase-interacting 4-like [Schistosoma japonicum]|nr:C-Jun-amino-terminal kinase-interacting 4-like [Schistosoma japonicum]
MARCCGCKLIGGDEFVHEKIGGNVVHNLLPHIKMMARCCGCGECRAQPSSPYKDDGEMLWVECRAQPSSPYKDDGEMLWVWNVVHNLLPHIKMMARCCGCGMSCTPSSPYKDDGEMLWVWECRAQPSSPYKDDGEMLWCKLIGGDELCMKK